MKPPFLCVFFFMMCVSCQDCEDSTEPNAKILFHSEVEHEQVLAVVGDNLMDVEDFNGDYPLAINSDTTTFLFYKEDEVDTLSIRYKREFYFESEECGFTVILSEFQYLDQTTYDSVTFQISPTTSGLLSDLKKNEYRIKIFN